MRSKSPGDLFHTQTVTQEVWAEPKMLPCNSSRQCPCCWALEQHNFEWQTLSLTFSSRVTFFPPQTDDLNGRLFPFHFIFHIPWDVVPAIKEVSVVGVAGKAVSCEVELSVGLVEAGEGHSFLERKSGKVPWKRWAVSPSLHIDMSWFLPSCSFKQGPHTRIPGLQWHLISCCLHSSPALPSAQDYPHLSLPCPFGLTMGLLDPYVLEILARLSLI